MNKHLQRRTLLVALIACIGSNCAHTRPEQMTAAEHREEATRHEAEAAQEQAQFDPAQTHEHLAPRTPLAEPGVGLVLYNPTAGHLAEADRQMRAAFEHLKSARQLEKFEDVACTGISVAERTSCPLLAPQLESVEEIAQGLALHLKPTAPAKTLAIQMGCHLAYANANGFDRAPCPLYVRGIRISLKGTRTIELRSLDPTVAREVRLEARRMFGEPAGSP